MREKEKGQGRHAACTSNLRLYRYYNLHMLTFNFNYFLFFLLLFFKNKTDVLKHVQERFSIQISQDDELPITFVHLHEYAHYLQPSKRLSLLVESFGTMRLAYQALKLSLLKSDSDCCLLLPDIFVDTTGYAFTYMVARVLFNCSQVWAYVHYPTISTDMLKLVYERRRTAYNHSQSIASSQITTYIKLLYYLVFAAAYGFVGGCYANLVMVNSTWTYNHIRRIWKYAAWRQRIRIVYPPCNVSDLLLVDGDDQKQREPIILSIGQFRPEKDHVLQIEAMALLLKRHPELSSSSKPKIKLVMVGSCRGKSDEERLAKLQELTRKLDLSNSIQFVVNQPYSVIKDLLARSSIGIHTVSFFGVFLLLLLPTRIVLYLYYQC